MDAETLVPIEVLEQLHRETDSEVLIRLSTSDAYALVRHLEIWQEDRQFMLWSARVRAALRNATSSAQQLSEDRLFAVSVAVHTDSAGNLKKTAIIDSREVTE